MGTDATQAPGWAFLSIIDWPTGWDLDQKLRAVVGASGLDPFLMQQRVLKPAPCVIHRMNAFDAAQAVESLRGMGVVAFAPTDAELRGIGEPALIKNIARDGDALVIEAWRSGQVVALRGAAVYLVIRSAIAIRRRSTPPAPADLDYRTVHFNTSLEGLIIDTSFAAAAAASQSASQNAPASSYAPSEYVHRIEVFTRDGSWFRVDSEKFAWLCLGGERTVSSTTNAELLMKLFSESFSGAILDRGFEHFSGPEELIHPVIKRAPMGTHLDAVYEFYTRWALLMYRRLTAPR